MRSSRTGMYSLAHEGRYGLGDTRNERLVSKLDRSPILLHSFIFFITIMCGRLSDRCLRVFLFSGSPVWLGVARKNTDLHLRVEDGSPVLRHADLLCLQS